MAQARLSPSEEFAARCVERAAGNPLFLEQLLCHAEENARAAGVPGSVQSLVQARMDRLDPADKQALQAASVLGQRFGADVLGFILDRPDYTPERLIVHRLVRWQGEAVLFAHALVREAVYDTLLNSRRRALHRRAAEWFDERDPILYAEHLDRADDPEAPRAYLRAARSQAAEYHYEAAVQLERGRALAIERTDRFALAYLHGDLLYDLGAISVAESAYRSAGSGVQLRRAVPGLDWAGRNKAGHRRPRRSFRRSGQGRGKAVEQGLIAEQARIHFARQPLFPGRRLRKLPARASADPGTRAPDRLGRTRGDGAGRPG